MTATTNKEKQRITLFVKSLLLKHARAQAIVEGITLTKLVEQSILAYLPGETVIKKPKI